MTDKQWVENEVENGSICSITGKNNTCGRGVGKFVVVCGVVEVSK